MKNTIKTLEDIKINNDDYDNNAHMNSVNVKDSRSSNNDVPEDEFIIDVYENVAQPIEENYDDSNRILGSEGTHIICRHCSEPIEEENLRGLSLLCPFCGKPQINGAQNSLEDPYSDLKIICSHCGELINQVNLIGLSLICPVCGMPQNGETNVNKII